MEVHPNSLSGARLGVVGRGRLGTALADALRAAGLPVEGPGARGEVPVGCRAILLCVPDGEIGRAAAAVAGAAPFVGHVSGATPLAALDPATRAGAEAFGVHPLQTFAPPPAKVDFAGAACAVAGSSPAALELAEELAELLGMRPFAIDDKGRAAYHAAASIASNFLLTLAASAERVAGAAGLDPDEARALLLPLVRRTVENWGSMGPERALTGPVARGDEDTVRAQRAAVESAAPDLLPLFDELLSETRSLAAREVAA
jgi:predicted short-subunit dehydrogenase-like oxidoreductase (DUF2520 family)